MQQFFYDAFISYRHSPRDSKIAALIQHELEHFVIPKTIRRTYGISRIDRIFRDESELQLSSDLSGQIEHALDRSRFLIVILSEDYLASRWCLGEIEYFLKNHDRDHVICVLAQGDPPGIFPEILRSDVRDIRDYSGRVVRLRVPVEPLACDWRTDEKHAKRIELPRLAARIIGCSYDELIMRRERYRRRRLTAFLSSAAAAAIIAVSYLAWSNIRINRSLRQSQINESRALAQQAIERLEDRDRLGALSLALEALPGEESSRPVTDDAVYALSRASYAYGAPFMLREVWRIDQMSDIRSFFLTDDGQYVVLMDAAGTIRTVDALTREEAVSFRFDSQRIPDSIAPGGDGEILAYINGEVFCADYRTGAQKWSMELQHQTSGTVLCAPDHSSIGTTDAYSVKLITNEGDYKLNIPLADDLNGYISDFVWSPDSSLIAAHIAFFGQDRDGVALFDLTASDYTLLNTSFDGVAAYGFDADNILYVLSSKSDASYSDIGGSLLLQDGVYTLTAFKKGRAQFRTDLPLSDLPDHCRIMPCSAHGASVALFIGRHILLIDSRGNTVRTYELTQPFADVIALTDVQSCVALKDGSLCIVDLTDDSILVFPAFPGDVTSAVSSEDTSCYYVLCDGNLSCVSYVYDASITYFDDESSAASARQMLSDENVLVLLCDRTLRFYDPNQRKLENILPLDPGDAYHLIDLRDGTLSLLHFDAKTAAVSVLFADAANGRILEEVKTPLLDYLLQLGVYTYPLSVDQADALALNYTGTTFLTPGDGILFVHDMNTPNRLIRVDLDTHSVTSLDVKLSQGEFLTLNGASYTNASPLILSDDGQYLFTAVSRMEGATAYDSYGAVIDLSTGSVTRVTEDLQTPLCAVWNGDELAVAGHDAIGFYDQNGISSGSLRVSGSRIVALHADSGILYALTSDNTLSVIRKGSVTRTVTLSFADTVADQIYPYTFTFSDGMLSIGHLGQIEVIRLDSESSMPLFQIPQKAIGYLPAQQMFLFHTEDPHKDSPDYFLASCPVYTIPDLITRARAQLDQF